MGDIMLSLRLASLTKYFNYNDAVIDIGCDHALLDIYLIKNNILKKMIVSDIHAGALKQGIANIEKEGLMDRIETRIGDGLKVLNDKDKVNTILISGMGTSTIIDILNNDYLNKINKMVIESNNDHQLLREEITKLGFYITNEEYLVDNNKSYINIVFARGDKKYSKNELRYGPILIHNKTYLNFELNNVTKIFNLVPKKKIRYRFILKKEIRLLNKLINQCQ